MALIAGAAVLTLVSGSGLYWYYGGEQENKKTLNPELIKELKGFKKKKLKDANKRKLSPKKDNELTKTLKKIRKELKLNEIL